MMTPTNRALAVVFVAALGALALSVAAVGALALLLYPYAPWWGGLLLLGAATIAALTGSAIDHLRSGR